MMSDPTKGGQARATLFSYGTSEQQRLYRSRRNQINDELNKTGRVPEPLPGGPQDVALPKGMNPTVEEIRKINAALTKKLGRKVSPDELRAEYLKTVGGK